MTEEVLEFDMSNEDTCMKQWTFMLEKTFDETIIKSIKIKPSGEGCVGHPKTIMALVKNTPVKSIDTASLSATKCMRTKSCGMNLATCVDAIQGQEKLS